MTVTNAGSQDTESLLQRAQQGDLSAVNQLLGQYRDRLRETIRRRFDPKLTRRVDPSDVVQDTLAEASQKLPKYLQDRPLPFYPWLRRLAWDRLVAEHRRHVQASKRTVEREEDREVSLSDESAMKLAHQFVKVGSSPSVHAVRHELTHWVRRALRRMPVDRRELLLMRHVERMSLEEIASSVGIPVGTVKSRMFRALEQLQQILESLLPEDAR